MHNERYGVFFRDQGVTEYLVAIVEDREETAHEEAARLDEMAFDKAVDGFEGKGEEPTREDYTGMHYVEPISAEVAEHTADLLARNIAVRVN